MTSRLHPWKIAALVTSLALAAAFVGYRVWSASQSPGPGPVRAAPAAADPHAFFGDSKFEPVFLGGSKSLIFVEPKYEAPKPAPVPPQQAR